MKKIVVFIMILGLTNLFALSKERNVTKSIDEIEILVNDLLNEQVAQKETEKEFESEKTVKAKYYIQMFAYAKSKPEKLIEKIRERGYNVVISKALRNEKKVRLVLVGPYKNGTLAKRELKILRDIEKDAFIYKIK